MGGAVSLPLARAATSPARASDSSSFSSWICLLIFLLPIYDVGVGLPTTKSCSRDLLGGWFAGAKQGGVMANGIVDRPFSRRSFVHACQAELFFLLARELIEACTRRPQRSLDDWFDLPEYRRFIIGTYAAGFVCSDLGPMKEYETFSAGPREHLATVGFSKLRHWIQTLLRAKRWTEGLTSPIRIGYGKHPMRT